MARVDLPTTPARDAALEAARLLRQSESLCEVIESISSELALCPLLTLIVRHACELLDAHDGAVGLYDSERDLMRIESTYRMPEGCMGMEVGPGMGLAGQVLLTRKAVVLERYDMLPAPILSGYAAQAVIGIPIMWHERLIGCFAIGAHPPRRFDTRDVEMLVLLARHAAIAIQNARQHGREAERNQRLALIARIGRNLTAELELGVLLQTTADQLHELLGYPNIGIGLLDPADPSTLVIRTVGGGFRTRVAGEHRFSIAQGLMGAAVRERRVQLVNDVATDSRYLPPPDVPGIRAELAVPILLGDDVLGVLNVESGGRFTEEDSICLQIIADHLAVAIQNTRLFDQARRLAGMEERQRLARDFHDSITQMLFSASLMSQSIAPAWRRDTAEGERITARVVELSRTALAEMRALLPELRTAGSDANPLDEGEVLPALAQLHRLGLPAAVRHDVIQVSSELAFELDLDRYTREPFDREAVLYRVFQESLHNVLRHAQASWVRIRLAPEGDRMQLRIVDDGVGFVADGPPAGGSNRSGGVGLANMRERLASVGGELRVHSRIGVGTTVEAFLPMNRS